jgi:hypothetical protein
LACLADSHLTFIDALDDFLTFLGLVNDTKSVILGCIQSLVLLATFCSPLVELVEAFDLGVLRRVAPDTLARILKLVDLGLARTLLVALVVLVLLLLFVVLQSVLTLAHLVVKIVITVAASALILRNVVDIVISLGFKGGLSLVFEFLLRLQSMFLVLFDFLLNFLLLQQEVDDVESHRLRFAVLLCTLNDLLSVFLGDLFRLLWDLGRLGSFVNVDLDWLNWLLYPFELHPVNIKVFEMTEELLLAAWRHHEFALLVDLRVLAQVAWKLFRFVNAACVDLPLLIWQFSAARDQQQVEQVFDWDALSLITFASEDLPKILEQFEVVRFLAHGLRQETESRQDWATRLVWNRLSLLPLVFLFGHVLNDDTVLASELLLQIFARLVILLQFKFLLQRLFKVLVLVFLLGLKLLALSLLQIVESNLNGRTAVHRDLRFLMLVLIDWLIDSNAFGDRLDLGETFENGLALFSFKHFLRSGWSFKWLDSILVLVAELGSLFFVLLLKVVVLVRNVLLEVSLLFAFFARVDLRLEVTLCILDVDVPTTFEPFLFHDGAQLLDSVKVFSMAIP